jgi:hypothetical protein
MAQMTREAHFEAVRFAEDGLAASQDMDIMMDGMEGILSDKLKGTG